MRISIAPLLIVLLGASGCIDTDPPVDDDDDVTFSDDDDSTADDDDSSSDDDDSTADDDDSTADDDDSTADDDDSTGDDDDSTGDDDDSTQPPLPFVSGTAGGQVLTSPSYQLELFVAPAEPIGQRASASYQLHLGPGAIRAAQ